MCPFWDKDLKVCKVFRTTQDNWRKENFCFDTNCKWADCPNYRAR